MTFPAENPNIVTDSDNKTAESETNAESGQQDNVVDVGHPYNLRPRHESFRNNMFHLYLIYFIFNRNVTIFYF